MPRQLTDEEWREQQQWVVEGLWEWLQEEDKRGKAAEQRNKDLVQVHRDGWNNLAKAVTTGLSAIADAIRDHGRR